MTTATKPPNEFLTIRGNKLCRAFHPGQARAWDSERRFVAVIAGTQSGKTVFGPHWLHREITRRGPGDYLVATPTFPLLQLKALPEFLKLFKRYLGLGDYVASPIRQFRFSKAGLKRTFGTADCEPTTVFFGHAADPDSLESATAKAAWLDEAGQNKFRLSSWEAIQRRLSIYEGRAVITTTPYCYDQDTEIYTRNGWKLFGSLLDTDEVLACEPGGRAFFERPKEIVWEPYEGPMIRLKGGRVDLLVTPNHRVLYRNSSRFYTCAASEFVKKAYRSMVIPKTVRIDETSPQIFELPSIQIGHRWGPRTRPAVAIPMSDWCAFMGWFLSEGSVRGCNGGKVSRQCYRIELSQSNGPKKDVMRSDLARLPFVWSEHANGFSTANKQLWAYLSPLKGSGEKRIPDEIKRASAASLRVLINRMVLGDGTFRDDRHGEFVYYTTSPQLAKDFQEVCMLTGISVKVAERENVVGGANSAGRSIKGTRTIFHVSQRKRRGGIVQSHETVNYSGHIGCVTVSTGYVLIRRNGEECVSGNSLGWLKQKVYDRWKAGDKTYDVIRFDSTENPAFPKEEFERARATLPPWKFDLFYRALFSRPAGMIYDCFDEERHKVRRFALPREWPRFLGLDFGGVNTAGVFIAREPGTERLYLYREYLAGGRTAKEHVAALLDGEPMVPFAVGGAKSEDQWRNEFRAAGLPVRGPVVDDVEVGINRVYATHKLDQLFVFDDLAGYLEQKLTYARELDDAGEPTEKIEDKETFHFMDAERYIVGYLKPLTVPFEPAKQPQKVTRPLGPQRDQEEQANRRTWWGR